ncbi:MAG: NAD(P)-dependent oxidoreductase [Candidatus Thorarchaeota archaeon]|nr:MAG: NAD(P)-dependent oxidoreductase [Candidatus Thorarchaeota archaeon]
MRVLLTGAFGNVGESAMLSLLETDHDVCCIELRTSRNEKVMKQLLRIREFETIWGDIRDPEVVLNAMRDVECVIHLAAIIPPTSDVDPDLTRAVNIGGTTNILEAAQKLGSTPKMIYASSIATYGHCTGRGPPKTANDTQMATDLYTETMTPDIRPPTRTNMAHLHFGTGWWNCSPRGTLEITSFFRSFLLIKQVGFQGICTHGEESALNPPAELNYHVYAALAENPEASPEDIAKRSIGELYGDEELAIELMS